MLVLTDAQIAEFLNNPCINPLTNRSIDPSGRLAKKLRDACSCSCPRSYSDRTNVERDMFIANPTVNPESGRKITFNGVTYKRLVAVHGKPESFAADLLAEAKRKETNRQKTEEDYARREHEKAEAANAADLLVKAKRAAQNAERYIREEMRVRAQADAESMRESESHIDPVEVIEQLMSQMLHATSKIFGKATNIKTRMLSLYIHPDKCVKYDDGSSARKTLIKMKFMCRLFTAIAVRDSYECFDDILDVARQVPIEEA